jgi:hypothetical protein
VINCIHSKFYHIYLHRHTKIDAINDIDYVDTVVTNLNSSVSGTDRHKYKLLFCRKEAIGRVDGLVTSDKEVHRLMLNIEVWRSRGKMIEKCRF